LTRACATGFPIFNQAARRAMLQRSFAIVGKSDMKPKASSRVAASARGQICRVGDGILPIMSRSRDRAASERTLE
jgi:hypothetical protein